MFNFGCTSDKIWDLPGLLQYLLQHQGKTIDIKLSPEAICLTSLGFYKILDCFDFERVNIYTHNPFETHRKYNIVYIKNHWFEKRPEILLDSLHQWNQTKKFLCFYHRPTASRLGIAGQMFSQYTSQSHIHFSAGIDNDNLIQFELDKLLGYDSHSIESAGEMINHLTLLLGLPDRYTWCNGYYYDDPLSRLYADILVDLVVESHVIGQTFFPTEKTLRPIWMKKPFISFASRDYLCYLRQMGFMTFSNHWDESYDAYEGKERYTRILSLIDSLAAKSASELNDMYHSMKYVLDHNYNLLLNQTYTQKVTRLD